MALLNPAYGLIVPFLFVVTIPLAILAGITTTLAFSILMFRVAVVYIDIALNMVPQYITGHRIYPFPRAYAASVMPRHLPASDMPTAIDSRAVSGQTTPSPTTTRAGANAGRHHRRRRTSTASFASVGSITPIEDTSVGLGGRTNKRADSVMMISSIGMDRDFEGVGGWRLNVKDADDDNAWAQLNSRLELPLDLGRRQHHRTPSGGGGSGGGGSITPGGGGGGAGDYLMMKSPRASRSKDTSPDNAGGKRDRERKTQGIVMSPNSSRQRTPPNGLLSAVPPLTTRERADGSYFPPLSPKIPRKAG